MSAVLINQLDLNKIKPRGEMIKVKNKKKGNKIPQISSQVLKFDLPEDPPYIFSSRVSTNNSISSKVSQRKYTSAAVTGRPNYNDINDESGRIQSARPRIRQIAFGHERGKRTLNNNGINGLP